jgi:predicted nucleic acid-binding Zn ribbon protein
MPIYIYQHPVTEELVEVVQSMSEDHIYFDENGLEWKRVFVSSQLNTQGTIDHWSSNDFVNKTANTKGSY